MAASADSRARRKRTRRMRVCAATVGKPAPSGGAPRRELVATPLPTTGRRRLVRRNLCRPRWDALPPPQRGRRVTAS